ncbi:hypothetical protein SanaruYs_35610 [Chryseotalea sanaruensis]|uniref:Uncharacterized protein n=1 Tax=Chryseotalea sanaruensis TaxID=2482724 RepID=A0A401UEI1_9BACT|nr:hypothetical protein [Chryseotalea sanaruensis]GCC53318.1 hypothetical protein SanaruYs_35610 [Chryseotalea sanaruensis]
MKYLILWIILFITVWCSGQTLPKIKFEGQSINDFVPDNWRIISTASGDLNEDNYVDEAIVIQEMDSKKVIISEGSVMDTLDTNPRMLIILFKDFISNQFRLKEISGNLIPNHYSPTMDDPFDNIMISKGVLTLNFHFWYSAGSWYQTFLEYKFRFQKNEFYLIGAEFDETDRGTSEGLKRSFNFLTRKMSETSIRVEEDESGEQIEKIETKWKTLEIKELKTIKTLTGLLKWTVAPDVEI